MVKSVVDIEREKTEKMIDPTLDLILRLRIRQYPKTDIGETVATVSPIFSKNPQTRYLD